MKLIVVDYDPGARSTNGREFKQRNKNENGRLLVSDSLYWQISYMTIGGLGVQSNKAIERLPSNRVDIR